MPVPRSIVIHAVVAEIFQFGSKWWTDQLATSMAKHRPFIIDLKSLTYNTVLLKTISVMLEEVKYKPETFFAT